MKRVACSIEFYVGGLDALAAIFACESETVPTGLADSVACRCSVHVCSKCARDRRLHPAICARSAAFSCAAFNETLDGLRAVNVQSRNPALQIEADAAVSSCLQLVHYCSLACDGLASTFARSDSPLAVLHPQIRPRSVSPVKCGSPVEPRTLPLNSRGAIQAQGRGQAVPVTVCEKCPRWFPIRAGC